MSERTSRPPVVPLILGLLLVAAVIAAAMAIERATDGDVDLPDTVAGGLVADSALPEAAVSAERELEETLDETVTLGTYRDRDGERSATITVVDAEAGPFAPDGPQPVPESLGLARAATELVRDGDVLCQVAWATTLSEGDEVPDEDPVAVFCQLGADGRTYWLNGRDLSVDLAVDILEDVRD
jgi:hypothetical protein